MAAPTYKSAGAGAVGTGAGLIVGFPASGNAVGDFVIVHILQDGTAAQTPSATGLGTIVENLAGTDDALTFIGTFTTGSVRHHLWCGRITSTLANGATTSWSIGSEDCYGRIYTFSNVNTGTTLNDVMENSSAGGTATSNGVSTGIADAAVVTLGADRLALNFVGVNDDNAVAAFTGMSGGTWAEAVAEYATATGTDACIQLQTAAMASAGTIDGGSYTMLASDAWGVVGFALIGTTSGGTPIAGTDTATVADVAAVSAELAGSDTVAAAEQAPQIALASADSAAAAEAASVVATVDVVASDAVTASDANAGIQLVATDTVAATDTAAAPFVRPLYKSLGTASGNGTSGAGSTPGTIDAGDLQLAFVSHSVAAATITPPDGWLLVRGNPGAADLACWAYARTYQPGDPSPTWTFSTSGDWGVDIVAYDHVDTAILDVASIAEQVGTGASNVLSLGPITPAVGDCLLVGYAVGDATSLGRTWTQSGAMVERLESNGTNLQRAIAEELLDGGGGTPVSRDFTFSGTANDLGGFLVALSPAGRVPHITASDAGAAADAVQALQANVAASDAGAETGAVAVGVAAADTAIADEAVGSIALAATEALAAADVALQTETGGSDAATGSDTNGGVQLATTDDASASEQVLFVALAQTDTATVAADVAAVEAQLTGADSAAGTDTADLQAQLTGADTVVLTDTAELQAELEATDSGSGTEAVVSVALQTNDAGSAADSGSIDAGSSPVAASDSATATEAVVEVQLAGSDTASATDMAGLQASLEGSDSGSTTESGSVSADAQIAASDAITATESASVEALVAVADAVTASEGAPTIELSVADAIAAVDAIGAIGVAAADSATALDQTNGEILLAAADLIAASEQVLSVAIMQTDTATAAEGALQLALDHADDATATDVASVAAGLAAADAAAADELAALLAQIAAADLIAASETTDVETLAPDSAYVYGDVRGPVDEVGMGAGVRAASAPTGTVGAGRGIGARGVSGAVGKVSRNRPGGVVR